MKIIIIIFTPTCQSSPLLTAYSFIFLHRLLAGSREEPSARSNSVAFSSERWSSASLVSPQPSSTASVSQLMTESAGKSERKPKHKRKGGLATIGAECVSGMLLISYLQIRLSVSRSCFHVLIFLINFFHFLNPSHYSSAERIETDLNTDLYRYINTNHF